MAMRNYLKMIKNYLKKSNQAFNNLNGDIDNKVNQIFQIQQNRSFSHVYSNIDIAKSIFFHEDVELINKIPQIDTLLNHCLMANIKFLFYSSERNLMYFQTEEKTILMTDMYYWILIQMFSNKLYELPPFWKKDNYTVFDFGMNRGFSTLWFAQDKKCKNVFAYEVDKDTYNFALENIRLNPHLTSKILTFDYGVSNVNDTIDLTYIPGEDSVSTIQKKFVKTYYSKERKLKIKTKQANVRKAGEIIKETISKHNIKDSLVLKIDVEGAEYDIFDDMISSKVLDKFDLILGECHYGMEGIYQRLQGFELVNLTKINKQLYNFCFINTKHSIPTARNQQN